MVKFERNHTVLIKEDTKLIYKTAQLFLVNHYKNKK